MNGAELLDNTRMVVTRYVVLPSQHAVVATVLWIVATHGISAFEHATRLAVHSAVKRCGKSRLLEVIESLVHKPIATTNISVPALFRMIDAAGESPPTLVLDEADRLFGSTKKDEDNRDLIAIINNGFRQGSPTWRCVGPMQTPTPFSNFAMAVIAGIGRKPDTIEDRAINITMRRRLAGETVAKFRLRTDRPQLQVLRDQLAVWAEQNRLLLEEPVADIPDDLEDRAADAWEPLIAVADAAGGDWPQLAREAAKVLCAEAIESDTEGSVELRLLADIRDVFTEMPGVGFLASAMLVMKLREIEDAAWRDIDLTAKKLSDRMGKFGVKPHHNSAKTARGYHLEDLLDPFRRYLRPEPSEPVPTGSDQQKRRDGSEAPDGLNRPADSNRPAETAGQTLNGQVRTLSDATPGGEDLCRDCQRPQPEWVLEERDGRCVRCDQDQRARRPA